MCCISLIHAQSSPAFAATMTNSKNSPTPVKNHKSVCFLKKNLLFMPLLLTGLGIWMASPFHSFPQSNIKVPRKLLYLPRIIFFFFPSSLVVRALASSQTWCWERKRFKSLLPHSEALWWRGRGFALWRRGGICAKGWSEQGRSATPCLDHCPGPEKSCSLVVVPELLLDFSHLQFLFLLFSFSFPFLSPVRT